MTRDDIIRMAREAGLLYTSETSADWSAPIPKSDYPSRLKRFAALVRAAEREACINACDTAYHQHIGPELGSVRYGIAACARAIRKRGNHEQA